MKTRTQKIKRMVEVGSRKEMKRKKKKKKVLLGKDGNFFEV